MLSVKIDRQEYYNEETNTFVTIPERTLTFEHSLRTISEWEEKWKIPFLSDKDKTEEQAMSYLMIMCKEDVTPEELSRLSSADMLRIKEYIEDAHTATWFSDKQQKKTGGPVTTAEIVYYWMTAAQIPFEAQDWHFNKLITLIRVAGEKNAPKKKMSQQEKMARHKSLNQQRRAAAAKR